MEGCVCECMCSPINGLNRDQIIHDIGSTGTNVPSCQLLMKALLAAKSVAATDKCHH